MCYLTFGVMTNIFFIIGIRCSARALKWYKPDGSIFISKTDMNFSMVGKNE